ncbi:MAG: hypothetical protein P8O23_11210 [Opitutales bacterium]|nr:hypothetical protein [Opitutales bacterium]
MDPNLIILTFHSDPATRRALTWRTDKRVTKEFTTGEKLPKD